jgi:short-subunit dehydrogenase
MSQGHGRIIYVGSFADLVPVSNSSAYAASKGGLRALTNTVGADMGNDHPDAICVE